MASDERGATTGPTTHDEVAATWLRQADELYKALPAPPISRLEGHRAYDVSNYKHKPATTPAEAAQKCLESMEKYDGEACKAYREEIDTLLVFAGLFSAVVTAFCIESYQWLQDDPNDTIIALLSQLAHPANQTQTPAGPKGFPDDVSARINAYWFLALVLGLSAALVAILCKQWVREFERHSEFSDAAELIGIRQMKLEAFESWRVSAIIAAVPLLLQWALGLFALGLIELLWNLHRTVAIVVMVPTMASLVFYTLTTLLPGLQAICSPFRVAVRVPQCPFKSSQAMLALRILMLVRRCIPEFLCCNFAVMWRSVHGYFWTRRYPPPSDLSSVGHLSLPYFLPSMFRYSWRTVDNVFTFYRDIAFGFLAFRHGIDSATEAAIPPGYYYRGLIWLHNHIARSDMMFWIFWSTWLSLYHPRARVEYPSVPPAVKSSHVLYGIRAVLRDITDYHRELPKPSDPASLVLCCARMLNIDSDFIYEAIIHYVSTPDSEWVSEVLAGVHDTPAIDSGTLASILHAVLSNALYLPTVTRRLPKIYILADLAYEAVGSDGISLILPALACLTALYLRELHLEAIPKYRVAWELCKLLRAVMTHLFVDKGPTRHTAVLPAEQAVFSALALAVDECLEALVADPDTPWHLLDVVAPVLIEQRNRAAYLELLSSALGSPDLATDHYVRNALPALRGYQKRHLPSQDHAQAFEQLAPILTHGNRPVTSPERTEYTEVHPSTLQSESANAETITTANQSAHLVSAARRADFSDQDANVPWVSQGCP